MALKNIKIPLYGFGEDSDPKFKCTLTVDEFAGRLIITISKGRTEIEVECYFDDLRRAWNAVKR